MFSQLNIDLLRTFVAVVESGSLTKASRTVFRSPAAVSMQVKRLEELIGQPLFAKSLGESADPLHKIRFSHRTEKPLVNA